jgi:hypothetical protein
MSIALAFIASSFSVMTWALHIKGSAEKKVEAQSKSSKKRRSQ